MGTADAEPVKWTVALPSGAAACLGAAIGLDVTQESQSSLAAAVGLYVLASVLVGAWIVLITREKE